jgi:hypothetical protein
MKPRAFHGAFVLTLALAIGALPLTVCLDPAMAMAGETAMACCAKGHDCPPATDAHDCCASTRALDQQLVPGKSDPGALVQPAVLVHWLTTAPVPAGSGTRVAPAPRARSAPLYLVDSTLRI